MGCYTTRVVSATEVNDIFNILVNGVNYTIDNKHMRIEKNYRVYLILYTICNVGLRVSDILQLTPNKIKGSQLTIVEKKTNKQQVRQISTNVYSKLMDYCLDNNIKSNELIFKITERNVQKVLKKVCEYLNLENVSTHSFRKFYATSIYQKSDNDLFLVKELLNHSFISTTQRYIGKDYDKINKYSAMNLID